jgi:putative undecaprenyl-phosphate alpha-N-acetylglucosaminyltransferase
MMGGGSETMGLVLAAAGIIVTGQVDPSVLGGQQLLVSFLPLLLPISVICVPIGDLVVTTIRRMLRGKSPFHADRSHFHDRLLARGHSHRGVVAILWMWTALVAFPPVAILVHDWKRVALCALPALVLGVWLTASEFPAFSRARRRARQDQIAAKSLESSKENA